ncbi:MAG TPA: hypothetical protein VFP72_12840 [Kineosporiaceae bacterium]|nr:hypothetical protein [Kineosporiaceae bacterium]
MNALFDAGREGFLSGEISYTVGVVKACPVEGYVFDAAHRTVADVTAAGGVLLGTPVALADKTATAGVADATDVTIIGTANGGTLAGGHTPAGWLLYQASGPGGGADVAAAAQRVIAWLDGRVTVTCASLAAGGDTTVRVDPLLDGLVTGSTIVFGAVTATLTAPAAAGDRAITVAALTGGIPAGTSGASSQQGNLPITTNGGNLTLQFADTASRIFRV